MISRMAVLWILRVGVALAVGYGTVGAIVARLDEARVAYTTTSLDAVWALRNTIDRCDEVPERSQRVVFFGDSLAQPADYKKPGGAILPRLATELSAGRGAAGSVHVCNVTYSALSIWSLYYLSDRLVDLRPEALVLEFNFFNFSSLWNGRDRKDLAVFLAASRLPQVALLPMDNVGFATDEWLFHRWITEAGYFDAWRFVQREQARLAAQYGPVSDKVQTFVSGSALDMRRKQSLASMVERLVKGRPRASANYARRLFGQTLGELSDRSPALVMLHAVIGRFRSAGVPVLVYIPPYNLDHLRELGVTDGSHFARATALVERVARTAGASFLDLHDILPDAYFRDQMDHLSEAPETDGHAVVARRLSVAVAEILPVRSEKGPNAF